MRKYAISDSQLISQYKNGIEEGFTTLVNRHTKKIYTTIYLIVKDQYLAEDLLQETFVKVVKTIKTGRYNEEGKFLPWVTRIAHNLAIDHFRRAKRYPTIVMEDGSSVFNSLEFSEDSFESKQIKEDTHALLRDLIKELPDAQREVLMMRHYMEMSFQEIADTTGNLAEFLEDVALATDIDGDKGDPDHVALMTIHLAKGLEFPTVFVVGLEEDLFPSAMSMNTRSELEEERRLFYVALTRAEKQAYLTYALSRYRWGKLIDSEPSRFIEEIDEQYLDIVTPIEERRFNPMLSAEIFGDVEPNKIRYKPAKQPVFKKGNNTKKEPEKFKVTTPKNLKPVAKTNGNTNLFDSKLVVGNIVKHIRFGTGEVMKIEGAGADIKAEINFQHGGAKKLLLRFAKLEVIG